MIVAAAVLTGCATYGHGIPGRAERVVVRTPAPPTTTAAVYHRADRDAQAYARTVGRAIRLSGHQQRAIHDQLTHRAHVLLERTHPRDLRYAYPFPRRANERDRAVQGFWRAADRDIERTLSSSQRRAYRDFVRHHFERRSPRQRSHPLGGPPGRRR